MYEFLEKFNILFQNQYLLFMLIIIIGIFSYLFTRYLLLNWIFRIFRKTSNNFDDILIKTGFFDRLSYAVPIVIIYVFMDYFSTYPSILYRIVLSLIIIAVISSVNAFINSINEFYSNSNLSKRLSIKSYLQILKLIINILGAIIFIASLIGKSPIYLLSGIGALTAVLMLIFKDTILSFISSIQITSNDLFKVGDWVEAPQFNADGDVIDIALHTIKIQNWDKTITVIPTHKLIDSSFKNWRGMSDSGGRRIKRAIQVDMNSVKFCDDRMISKFSKIDIISDYIDSKIKDIGKYNQSKNSSDSLLNGRALTNIGTYRKYISSYLTNNSNINKDMTFLVRQLSPTSNGLPIEIYVFSNNTDWIEYEEIQSDIFDHLIASIKEFDLVLFQNPTGNDFKNKIL
jgi:miniconductance mechanosensitive channel